MEVGMLHAAVQALVIIADPVRLMYLFAGVCMGLGLGILPGIGGIAGTALLLPFTYSMDSYSAFALLLGMGASTTTADPISAILFGAPGHAASAATTLDGYPMTRQGYAGRALGASYMAALMGGLFGALLLAVSLPILRPIMYYIGAPEMLGFAVFGLSMVSVLSGSAPMRGLTAACFGMTLAMIGADPQTGTLRWTGDSLYLMDGLPLVAMTLGIFALPELCDLAVARTAVVQGGLKIDTKTGMIMGIRDCFRHWWLILRCSWIGAGVGSIPGIGNSVIDWLSYGHALRSEKGARESFGRGDVRGVIAAESATNAKEGGGLVPTVAFGVPGSASMAILLGAFLIHGLVPGPDMLGKNLDITYSMVWSIAIANILGSGLCFLLSGQLAKLCTLRSTLIMPMVLSLIYIGGFEGTRQWGDLYSLLFFGAVGWGMKHFKWPRPPLVLGFILGKVLERYLFISIERYGTEWLTRPVVVLFFLMAASTLLRPLLQDLRAHGGMRGVLGGFGRPRIEPRFLFALLFLCLFVGGIATAAEWNFEAQIMPLIVCSAGVVFCSLSLINDVFKAPAGVTDLAGEAQKSVIDAFGDDGNGRAEAAGSEPRGKIHMDILSIVEHMPVAVKLGRGALFFGWMVAFLGSMAVIGLIPTVPIFIIAYMRLEGRERWSIVLPYAIIMALFIYVLFDQLLAIPWPPTVLGELVPAVKAIPSV